MGERGVVHVFRATWTEPDPDNPGKRRLRTAKTWSWRFRYRNKPFSGGGNFKTKSEARAAGDARKAEVMAGMEQDPRKTTWAALDLALVAEYRGKAESTRKSLGVVLARLRPFFKHDFLSDITRNRWLQYVAKRLDAGAQPSTVNLERRFLLFGLRLMHEARLLQWLPKLPLLKTNKREQFFRPDLFESVLSFMPIHYQRFFRVADEMGWRARSELRSRKWTDVDFENGWVALAAAASKTNKRRVFPMTDHLRKLLEEQEAYVKAVRAATGKIIPHVFVLPDGRPIGDWGKTWRKALQQAGVEPLEGRKGPWSSGLVPHDIRRTTLARWEMDGVPRNASMAAAGHDEERTFSGYAKASPEAMKAMGERLDEARQRRAGETKKVVPIRRDEKAKG